MKSSGLLTGFLLTVLGFIAYKKIKQKKEAGAESDTSDNIIKKYSTKNNEGHDLASDTNTTSGTNEVDPNSIEFGYMTAEELANIPNSVLSEIRLEEWDVTIPALGTKQISPNSPYTGVVKQVWSENTQLSFKKWENYVINFDRLGEDYKYNFFSNLKKSIQRSIS